MKALIYSIILLCTLSCTKIEYMTIETKTTDTLFISIKDSVIITEACNHIIPTNTNVITNISNKPIIINEIIIGNQTWMSNNLSVDKYNDGTEIAHLITNEQWSSGLPGYCYYKNDSSYDSIYGKLYNWHTITTSKLCPLGWRVPTESDWDKLIAFTSNEGGRLKSIDYWYGNSTPAHNTTTSDEYGFSALPGQLRFYNGTFLIADSLDDTSQMGYYWTSTLHQTQAGALITIKFRPPSAITMKMRHSLNWGFSVRCIKNEN